MDQALKHERPDAEPRGKLAELEFDARGLAQYLHLPAGSSSTDGELRHRFKLGDLDAESGHRLRQDDVGKRITTVDESVDPQFPETDGNARTVALVLPRLEIDLGHEGRRWTHGCKRRTTVSGIQGLRSLII